LNTNILNTLDACADEWVSGVSYQFRGCAKK
jgi:hypothetical protein